LQPVQKTLKKGFWENFGPICKNQVEPAQPEFWKKNWVRLVQLDVFRIEPAICYKEARPIFDKEDRFLKTDFDKEDRNSNFVARDL